jgi:hypothetical protein
MTYNGRDLPSIGPVFDPGVDPRDDEAAAMMGIPGWIGS